MEERDLDEQRIRAQIAMLFLRMHGSTVPVDGEDVDLLYAVFEDGRVRARGTRDAWTLVVAALLQDPGMMFL